MTLKDTKQIQKIGKIIIIETQWQDRKIQNKFNSL